MPAATHRAKFFIQAGRDSGVVDNKKAAALLTIVPSMENNKQNVKFLEDTMTMCFDLFPENMLNVAIDTMLE